MWLPSGIIKKALSCKCIVRGRATRMTKTVENRDGNMIVKEKSYNLKV